MTRATDRRFWAWAATILVAAHAQAQCMYEVVTFQVETCPGNLSQGTVNAISDNGVVVGSFLSCGSLTKAFAWTEDTGVVVLPVPAGALGRSAKGVATDGCIVGSVSVPPGFSGTAIHWPTLSSFELLPVPQGTFNSGAKGCGSQDAAAGQWIPLDGFAQPAMWTPAGFIDLGPEIPRGFVDGSVSAMTADGSMAGVVGKGTFGSLRGFHRTPDGIWSVIDNARGWIYNEARALNSLGAVVGRAWLPFGPIPGAQVKLPMRWELGVAELLPVLPGHNEGFAAGINDVGQTVGETSLKQDSGVSTQNKGVIWIDGEPYVLRDRCVAPKEMGGVNGVAGINNRGEIAAWTKIGDERYSVVLRPIGVRDGDITIDCKVDWKDILALFDFWGREYERPGGPGDANRDGVVDGYDLAVVLGAWDG